MIERYVFVKLSDVHAGAAERSQLAEQARALCAELPVVSARIALPADAAARSAWDLAITLQFASLSDEAAFATSALARELVHEEANGRIAVIKTWCFQVV